MKEIRAQKFRTGRIERRGYYDDLRAAACASVLLAKSSQGWDVSRIKYLDYIEKFLVLAILPSASRKRKNGR